MNEIQKWLNYDKMLPRSVRELMLSDDKKVDVKSETIAKDLHLKHDEMIRHIEKHIFPNAGDVGFYPTDLNSFDITFEGLIKIVMFSHNRKCEDIKVGFCNDLDEFYETADTSIQVIVERK